VLFSGPLSRYMAQDSVAGEGGGRYLNGQATRELELAASEEKGYGKLRARAKNSVGTA
jgi:hypothetical protein